MSTGKREKESNGGLEDIFAVGKLGGIIETDNENKKEPKTQKS